MGTRCAERYGHTGEDRDDGLVDGLNLLLLEEVAREEGRYEEAYRDEDGPRGERLALRDIICWTASASNKLWKLPPRVSVARDGFGWEDRGDNAYLQDRYHRRQRGLQQIISITSANTHPQNLP